MRLASIIDQFDAEFLHQYGSSLLPSARKALGALKVCRTANSPKMQVHCEQCDQHRYLPHSCGHRHCPHCQHYESQQWLQNQCQKQVPGQYFMITFTVPAQLRAVFFAHQRQCYGLLFDCVWQTLRTFSQNDRQLKGTPGVTAVLHTHARDLGYHPHIHAVIPAAAINDEQRLWREKKGRYLFCHKALAKVFRAKLLEAMVDHKLCVPKACPDTWVVDCRHVGSGETALIYLGRYLYRGVIQEKDILSSHDGKVTFRYLNSKTKTYVNVTVTGAHFLWLVFQHVLPRGFRRARNYGFLHPNSKKLIQLLATILHRYRPPAYQRSVNPRPALVCACCGEPMRIVQTQIPRFERTRLKLERRIGGLAGM